MTVRVTAPVVMTPEIQVRFSLQNLTVSACPIDIFPSLLRYAGNVYKDSSCNFQFYLPSNSLLMMLFVFIRFSIPFLMFLFHFFHYLPSLILHYLLFLLSILFISFLRSCFFVSCLHYLFSLSFLFILVFILSLSFHMFICFLSFSVPSILSLF